MVKLADDVTGQIRHAQQVVELELDHARDLVLDRQLGRHHLDHPRQELGRGAPEHRFRQALLAAEVVVQQRLVDARFGRDVLHARARRARGGGTPCARRRESAVRWSGLSPPDGCASAIASVLTVSFNCLVNEEYARAPRNLQGLPRETVRRARERRSALDPQPRKHTQVVGGERVADAKLQELQAPVGEHAIDSHPRPIAGNV